MVSIAALQPSEIAYVDQCLPLSRLDQQIAEGSTYLVAWDDDRPVGHAHIAWAGSHLGVPEIQDVSCCPSADARGSQLNLRMRLSTKRGRGLGEHQPERQSRRERRGEESLCEARLRRCRGRSCGVSG